jgi:hypothetical protein
MDIEFDGSSLGHDCFEKVINFSHVCLHFVLLN